MKHLVRTLFLVAALAQLAGPVLAANAASLNLLCPSHVSEVHGVSHGDSGHEHAHDHDDAHAAISADAGPSPDHGKSSPRYFDLACCSAHLTGVLPVEAGLSLRLIASAPLMLADDAPALLHASIDPPPRQKV